MRRILPLLAVLLLALAGWASADTTAKVLERGELLCGVSVDLSLGEPLLLVVDGGTILCASGAHVYRFNMAWLELDLP